jgi:hypothetical protein
VDHWPANIYYFQSVTNVNHRHSALLLGGNTFSKAASLTVRRWIGEKQILIQGAIRADEVHMLFESTFAYTIVAVTALFLGGMSIHNRHTGWRRTRSNTLLDILQAWAEARAEMQQETAAPGQGTGLTPPLSQPAMSTQLGALNAALRVNTGVSPGPSSAEDNRITTEKQVTEHGTAHVTAGKS